MFDEVYLTGFKKFGNVDVNPTELIVDALLNEPLQNVNANKLDVTTEEVDKYISNIKDQQCSSKSKILNIHCGVGPNKVYYL
jgi:pyrrolidone-carboxylate peptidase